jgi:glyoxylase-like metal-dependent hydrolase (beta-lactamase superfamily II)
MEIKSFFDKPTFTITYVVYDESTKDAVVIDPVRDYDASTGRVSTTHHDLVNGFVKDNGLKLHYILETHVHADHLTGAPLLKREHPEAQVVISEKIKVVQDTFIPVFNMEGTASDGSQFDKLVADGDSFTAGSLEIKVIATPGHTPACLTYHIGDALFTGDALFMPDMGTGRCDFPKGDADDLYASIQKIYALPDETRIFVGHDYAPGGREYAWETTVGKEKAENIQLKSNTTKEEFVTFRRDRDSQLNAPKLLLPSIQVNLAAGELPQAEGNGTKYIKIPVKE